MINHATICALVMAGHTMRCHTIPGGPYQTTGHHSYGVALLLEYIYPACTKAALLRALTHDCAESFVGDTPGHAKWASTELTAALANLEEHFEKCHGIDYDLDPTENLAIKAADLLDLLIYSGHQGTLGNEYFKVVCERVEDYFTNHPNIVATFPKVKEFL